MTTVLIAPDSFKGSLTSVQVARALADGWAVARPDDEILLCPLADGGEGTLAAIEAASGWTIKTTEVRDPIGRPVGARWLRSADGRRAFVEMAQASGLSRLAPSERDPIGATTHGTGELLRAVVADGVRHVTLGIGGSATTDGGRGLLDGLGEDLDHVAVEPPLVGRAERPRGSQGVQPRPPQRLVRVDVPDPGDERLVHEQRLEARAPPADPRPPHPEREPRVEWLRPDAVERVVVRAVQPDAPELADVAVAQLSAVGQLEDDPDVRIRHRIGRRHQQRTRHAERDRHHPSVVEDPTLTVAEVGRLLQPVPQMRGPILEDLLLLAQHVLDYDLERRAGRGEPGVGLLDRHHRYGTLTHRLPQVVTPLCAS